MTTVCRSTRSKCLVMQQVTRDLGDLVGLRWGGLTRWGERPRYRVVTYRVTRLRVSRELERGSRGKAPASPPRANQGDHPRTDSRQPYN
jgi:hypothetical protein